MTSGHSRSSHHPSFVPPLPSTERGTRWADPPATTATILNQRRLSSHPSLSAGATKWSTRPIGDLSLREVAAPGSSRGHSPTSDAWSPRCRRPSGRAGATERPERYFRWWRVLRSIFLCFFLRMRLRRFLMREPTAGDATASAPVSHPLVDQVATAIAAARLSAPWPVVQLVRTSDFDSGCCRFESCRASSSCLSPCG